MSTQDLADGRLTPFNGHVAPTRLACDNCGNTVHAGSVFCTSCGRSLAAPTATDAEPPSTPPGCSAKMCCLSLGVFLALAGLGFAMFFWVMCKENLGEDSVCDPPYMVAIVLVVLVCPSLCIWCFIGNDRCGFEPRLRNWSSQTCHINARRRCPPFQHALTLQCPDLSP